jgi:hypothetical protein
MRSINAILLTIGPVACVLAGPPAIPDTPVAVEDVVYARAFTLETGFKFIYREERPQVTEGMLLVIKADKDLLIPRAAKMPVLYVGNQTVHRLNYGHESGYRVVIVPGQHELSKTPIWFGTPNYPERMDATSIAAERHKAEAAGITPLPAGKIDTALARGGPTIRTKSLSELLRTEAAELILRYAPQEKHIAEGYRVPVVQKKVRAEKN